MLFEDPKQLFKKPFSTHIFREIFSVSTLHFFHIYEPYSCTPYIWILVVVCIFIENNTFYAHLEIMSKNFTDYCL